MKNKRLKRCVFVVGMHRSGTSAIARILSLGGGDLGADNDLAVGAPDNQTGFWEAGEIRAVNDDLLDVLGGSWSALPTTDPGWEKSSNLAPYRKQARQAIANLWPGSVDQSSNKKGRPSAPIAIVKDPRASITLPFWQSLIGRIDVVICVRNPLSVAQSLLARDQIPIHHGIELWLEYTLAALASTTGRPPAIIHYEDMMNDWVTAYDQIRDSLALGGNLLQPSDTIADSVDAFLQTDLQHHQATNLELANRPDASFLATSLYHILRYANENGGASRIEMIRALAKSASREHYDDIRSVLKAVPATPHVETPVDPSKLERSLESDQTRNAPGTLDAMRESLRSSRASGAKREDQLRTLLGMERERTKSEQSSMSQSLVSTRSERDSALLARQSAQIAAQQSEERIGTLEAKLGETLLGLQELAEEKQGLQSARDHSNQKAAERSAELNSVRTEVQRLGAETAVAEERLQYAMQRIDVIEGDLLIAHNELGLANDALAHSTNERNEANRQAQSSQAGIAAEAAVAEERLQSATHRIDVMEGDLLIARNELGLANDALAHSTNERNEANRLAELNQASIANLTDQNANLSNLLQKTEQQRDEITQARDSADSKRVSLLEEIRLAHERAVELRTRHEEQTAGYQASHKHEQEKWQALFKSEQDRHFMHLSNSLDRISAEYETQVDRFRNSADALAVVVRDLERNLADREGQIAALHASRELNRIDDQERRDRLLASLAKTERDLSEANEQLEHLRAAQQLLEADSVDADQEISELRNQISQIRESGATTSITLGALQSDHSAILARHAITNEDLKTAQRKLATIHGLASEAGWLSSRRVLAALPLPKAARASFKSAFYGALSRIAPTSHRLAEYRQANEVANRRSATKVVDASSFLSIKAEGPRNFDVLIFSVIDWHFRHQRPQHIALELARQGHRVFYFATTFDTRVDDYIPEAEFAARGITLIQLPCPAPQPVIYRDEPNKEQIDAILAGIESIRTHFHIAMAMSIVNHPFWTPIVDAIPANRVIYDCMDHHAGFSGTSAWVVDQEAKLLRSASLVVCTAKRLMECAEPVARKTLSLPNAGEYEHFATAALAPLKTRNRPVVGYFGAIADWFDMELVAVAAAEIPEVDFILIGSTFGAELTSVESLSNVGFLGEIAYEDLPGHLAEFDVCLIPFKLNELTRSTNPVKIFEYLSAGKPVVSVRLPELEPMASVVQLTDTPAEFVASIRLALSDSSPKRIKQRQAFARENSWERRGVALDKSLEKLLPKVSIIVLTYNQFEFTTACLHSIESFTDYPNWELIIVDNASTDETPDFLRDYARDRSHVQIVLSDQNLGFAAGNNLGAEQATGDFIVFLNNDTYVTRGWIPDLLAHFEADPSIGLLGPVTNNIGNEARIDVQYADMEGMADIARAVKVERRHERTELRALAFFCVMLPIEVWTEIGGLDEGFKVGFFEDDDYANRIRHSGRRVICAEDTFIHHHLSASFEKLDPAERKAIFDENRAYYESKWGPWTPHAARRTEKDS